MSAELPKITPAFAGAADPSRQSARKRPPPFSLRLSAEERERLDRDAAGMSLGSYIRSRLFGDDATPRRRGKFPVRDHKLLAELLGKLGASRIANNLNQLAKLANLGTLPVTPELEEDLKQASAEIAAIKTAVMEALQVKER